MGATDGRSELKGGCMVWVGRGRIQSSVSRRQVKYHTPARAGLLTAKDRTGHGDEMLHKDPSISCKVDIRNEKVWNRMRGNDRVLRELEVKDAK